MLSKEKEIESISKLIEMEDREVWIETEVVNELRKKIARRGERILNLVTRLNELTEG